MFWWLKKLNVLRGQPESLKLKLVTFFGGKKSKKTEKKNTDKLICG